MEKVVNVILSKIDDLKHTLQCVENSLKMEIRDLKKTNFAQEERIRRAETDLKVAWERIRTISQDVAELSKETETNKKNLTKLVIYIAGIGGGTAVAINKLLSMFF